MSRASVSWRAATRKGTSAPVASPTTKTITWCWQFHRHRELLHQRDERIVSRRVYGGPSPECGPGHEIHHVCSGHRSERGWKPAQEYDAGRGSKPEAAANRLHRSLLGPHV